MMLEQRVLRGRPAKHAKPIDDICLTKDPDSRGLRISAQHGKQGVVDVFLPRAMTSLALETARSRGAICVYSTLYPRCSRFYSC